MYCPITDTLLCKDKIYLLQIACFNLQSLAFISHVGKRPTWQLNIIIHKEYIF
jgi:hypothetical protein